MKFKRLSRIAALGALCVAAGALTGLPWADASSTKAHRRPTRTQASHW